MAKIEKSSLRRRIRSAGDLRWVSGSQMKERNYSVVLETHGDVHQGLGAHVLDDIGSHGGVDGVGYLPTKPSLRKGDW